MAIPRQLALLHHAFPLIPTHGFSREAISLAALRLPAPHNCTEPLSNTAISALFGKGDEARKTLIRAWLEEGRADMGRGEDIKASGVEGKGETTRMVDILEKRLKWNVPVLGYLKEVRL